MIVGVGIDVCDVRRFAESIERQPGLVQRLFTPAEAATPGGLAGRPLRGQGGPGQGAGGAERDVVAGRRGTDRRGRQALVQDHRHGSRAGGVAADRAASTCRCPTTRVSPPPWWCARPDAVRVLGRGDSSAGGGGHGQGGRRRLDATRGARPLRSTWPASSGEARGRTYGARVLILVGPGNNGGDALFAGQRLAARGCAVRAVRCLGEPHAYGLAALLAAGGTLIDLAELTSEDVVGLSGADVVLDGVLGIGGRPGLPEAVAEWAGRFDVWDVPIIAVDLPSGVAADTGAVPGAAFRARRTVTFGSLKPCHLIEPARSPVRPGRGGRHRSGRREHRSRPRGLGTGGRGHGLAGARTDRRQVRPRRGRGRHRLRPLPRGGGAVDLRCGPRRRRDGPLQRARPRPPEIVAEQLPNVVFGEGRVQSWVLGSGWGDRPDGRERIEALIATGVFLVIDADGSAPPARRSRPRPGAADPPRRRAGPAARPRPASGHR